MITDPEKELVKYPPEEPEKKENEADELLNKPLQMPPDLNQFLAAYFGPPMPPTPVDPNQPSGFGVFMGVPPINYVPDAGTPSAPQAGFCPMCGAKVADAQRFCHECGTPLPKPEEKPAEESEKPEGSDV